ncbi:hypothetical protein [Haladaptatus salinisoli]|uniref:hypothetical protein n=1 Tax=Haladaptatus salinisoli TaxID=2884876 RepID=UPI001D0AD307|nr:hypothetical protein [Haladaptatus salinisoli]
MGREPASLVWTARTTLLVFGFLALTWYLPNVVDIYDSVLYRLLFVLSYVVMLLVYDSPWVGERGLRARCGSPPREVRMGGRSARHLLSRRGRCDVARSATGRRVPTADGTRSEMTTAGIRLRKATTELAA